MVKNNIEIKKVNITELLNEVNHSTIPYYQRNYDWGSEEIDRLIYDLISNNSNEYYCGSIIICKNLTTKKIVDGQQRISTFLLILKYLSRYMLLNNLENKFFKINNYEICSNNLKDKEILKELIQIDDDKMNDILDKYPKSRYVKNFIYINDKFNSMNSDEIVKFIRVFEQMVCSLVMVNEDYDEYRMFTNINSTGLPLNAFDLVKNFIFSKMELNEKEIIEKQIIFEKISKYLEVDEKEEIIPNKNRSKNLNELIRYFIAYKTGIFEKTEATMLFRKFEEIYKESFVDNIKELFNDFIEFGFYYKFIKTEFLNEKYNFYKSMRIINLQFDTFITLIIQILIDNSKFNSFSHDISFTNDQLKIIEKSLLVIESFITFRTYTNMRSNDLSRFIPTIYEKIKNKKEICSYPSALLSVLYLDQQDKDTNTKMPSKTNFIRELINAKDIYNNKKKYTIQLLIRIDEYMDEKANRYGTSKYNGISVEHIMPQNLNKWIEFDRELDENEAENYINSLGNLTILSNKLNIEMKNNIFELKKEKLLEKGTFIINNSLNQKHKWNIEDIRERTIYLANKISEIYSFNDLMVELRQKPINISVNELMESKKAIQVKQNFDGKNKLDTNKYLSTIKNHSKRWGINITYEKICEAIYQFCFENKPAIRVGKDIFNEPKESKSWMIHSIFRVLELDTSKNSIHKNKSKDWVQEFIFKKNELIREIVDYCNLDY